MKTQKIINGLIICTLSMLLFACASKKADIEEESIDDITFEELDDQPIDSDTDMMSDEFADLEAEEIDLPGEEEIEGMEEIDASIADVPAKPYARPRISVRRPYARSTVGYPDYSTPTAKGGSYIVQRGDSLWKIAQRNGTTISAIANANGISPDSIIRVGQKLIIPSGKSVCYSSAVSSDGKSYTVQSGDSYYSIGKKLGVNFKKLMEYNNAATSTLRVGQIIKIP